MREIRQPIKIHVCTKFIFHTLFFSHKSPTVNLNHFKTTRQFSEDQNSVYSEDLKSDRSKSGKNKTCTGGIRILTRCSLAPPITAKLLTTNCQGQQNQRQKLLFLDGNFSSDPWLISGFNLILDSEESEKFSCVTKTLRK